MANCLNENGNNALMIDVILDEIFQCLPWEDLSSCRRVCKKWYKCSQRYWLDAAPPLKLINHYGHKRQLSQVCKLASSTSPRFSYRWEGVRHYKKVDFENFTIGDNWNIEPPIWKAYGQWMTVIRLDDCKFTTLEAFRELVFGQATPNMKSLHIRHPKFQFSEYELLKSRDVVQETDFVNGTVQQTSEKKYLIQGKLESFVFQFRSTSPIFPISWCEFFNFYPDLKIIGFGGYLKKGHVELIRVLDALKLKKCTNLKEFKYSPENPLMQQDFPTPLVDFARHNFSKWNIDCLQFTFQQNSDLLEVFNLATERSKHLKILSLYGNPRIYLNLRLPPLRNLRDLRLHNVGLNNLCFLKEMPKLSKLSILRLDNTAHYSLHMIDKTLDLLRPTKNDYVNGSGNLVLHFLRELVIELGIPLRATHIVALKSWMPNLTALKLHLDDSSFRAVCEHFPGLETLYIYQGKVSEESLIGYLAQYEEGFGVLASTSTTTTDKSGIVTTKEQRQLPLFPNITDLTGLKDVSIFTEDNNKNTIPKLSERAIIDGFMHLKCLNKVSITRSCMTTNGYKVAVKHFGPAFKKNVPSLHSGEPPF